MKEKEETITRTFRSFEYYKDLLLKLRERTENLVEAKSIISELLTEKDGVEPSKQTIQQVRLHIKEILGSSLEETTGGKGAGNRALYWLIDARIVDEATIINKLTTYFTTTRKRGKLSMTKPLFKATADKFDGLRLRRKTIEELVGFLKYMVNRKGEAFLIDLENYNPEFKKVSLKYNEHMKRFGVLSQLTRDLIDKQWLIKVTRAEDALITVNGKLKEWYGTGGDLKEVLGMKVLSTDTKPVMPLSRIVEKEIIESSKKTTLNEDQLIWSMASLLELSSQRMEIEVLSRNLREQFNIYAGGRDIQEIIKSHPEWFEYNSTQRVVKIKELVISKIREQCGPDNYSVTFLARIGLSLGEVKKFFDERATVMVESRISDNDNIYSITMTQRIGHWRNLIRLYRTFRGSDKILGNRSLVEMLDKEVRVLEARELGEIKTQLIKLENGEML